VHCIARAEQRTDTEPCTLGLLLLLLLIKGGKYIPDSFAALQRSTHPWTDIWHYVGANFGGGWVRWRLICGRSTWAGLALKDPGGMYSGGKTGTGTGTAASCRASTETKERQRETLEWECLEWDMVCVGDGHWDISGSCNCHRNPGGTRDKGVGTRDFVGGTFQGRRLNREASAAFSTRAHDRPGRVGPGGVETLKTR
jgi:hypothetical protein